MEIKEEIETYGYDSILIVPENIPNCGTLNQQLIETIDEGVGKGAVAATWRSPNFTEGGSFAGVKNSYSSNFRLILTHSVQNLDNHPLLEATKNKNIMNLTGLDQAEVEKRIGSNQELPINFETEINGQTIQIQAEGLSLEEYAILQRTHFDKTGQHLDEIDWTWLLKSSSGSRVVGAVWGPGARRLGVFADDPGAAAASLGSRLSRSFPPMVGLFFRLFFFVPVGVFHKISMQIFYPSAKHSAGLLEVFFGFNVLRRIKKFIIQRQAEKYFEYFYRKYFENINHEVLLDLLRQEIRDGKIVNLLEIIVKSFNVKTGQGLPLGNITSQIFANVYLNELDKFVESELGLKNYYVRYCDDFIFFGHDKIKLLEHAEKINRFLDEKLFLELPQNKTVFRKLKWGIDFCGSVVLPNGILLRNRTKGRMFGMMTAATNKFNSGKISQSDLRKKFDSYFGLLSHCKAHHLKIKIRSKYLCGHTLVRDDLCRF